MDPGIRQGQPPPFYELDEYVFQELCRDLLEAEPRIATCDIYGVRGQGQDGIDLLAIRDDGDGVEVGQCKRYRTFSPAEIRAASDKFFEHWDRWSKEGVKRFVLFVACQMDTRQCQDEILTQTKRFREKDIAYEAWSAPQIRNKLRPHRAIVSTYLIPSEHWTRVICGDPLPPAVASGGREAVVVSSMLESLVGQLADQVSTAEQELEQARAAWREGRHADAAAWVSSVKGDQTRWAALSRPVKAKILRFEANFARREGDVARARSLADEAHQLAPAEDETLLRALIARDEGRSADALTLLEGCTDRDLRELRAGFLLEAGRTDEAWALLNAEDISSSAEGLRVRALAYLAEKKVDAARLEIEKALTLESRWASTRLVAAIIDYFSALSPCALPDHPMSWPEPVDWRLVRRDDEAQQRLRAAAARFAELASQVTQAVERRQIEIWHLACLLNDPQRQDDAARVCRTLLERDPSHEGAVLWAVARHLSVDLEPSVLALQRKLEDHDVVPAGVLALASIHLSAGEPERTLALLEKTRSVFESAGANNLWAFWWAQSLTVAGRPEEALSFIEHVDGRSAASDLAVLALRAMDGDSGRERLMTHLEARFQATGDAGYLFEACWEKAQHGEWAYVADRAEQVVSAVGTPAAVRLAAVCAYNAGKHRLCIKVLDENRRVFPRERLPAELRRLRALCLEHLGALPEAIRDTEALVRDEPTLDHQLKLVSLLGAMGDMKKLSLAARELESHPDLDGTRALGVAQMLTAEDSRLAAQFWRRAVQRGIPDELVGNALTIAFRLGLDQEVGDVVSRMQALALEGRGGFQMRPLRDLVTVAEHIRESNKSLSDAYRSGAAPVHMVTARSHTPLVDLYHQLLLENERASDPAGRSFLLIRYGGRPAWPLPQTRPERHLWLDLTAVLLAAHLDILDAVERTFKPLGLPPSLIPALLGMRSHTEPQQPARLRALTRMIELVDLGRLKIAPSQPGTADLSRALVEEVGDDWAALFEHAARRSGYLVDFLPVTKCDLSGDAATLPEDAAQIVTSCRSVVDALKLHGLLSEDVHAAALETMGASARPDAGAAPRLGAALFFQGNTLEMLISANVMDVVLVAFEVYVERGEVERARAELREANYGRALSMWLDGLVERLRRGLEYGAYERLPLAPDPELYDDASPAERCLLELMALQPRPETLAWVDDRHVLRYTSLNGTPTVGVLEVLGALVGAGEFSPDGYFEKVAQLRSANAVFIPLSRDEILYHLRKVRVVDDVVVESPSLRILRQSWAACLLRSDMLQRAASQNEPGELPFLFESQQAIGAAFVELWKNTSGNETAIRARAEWLLRKMYVDLGGLVHLLRLDGDDRDDLQFAASEASAHLWHALLLDTRTDDGQLSARQRYIQWLFERTLACRVKTAPGLLSAVARSVKDSLVEVLEKQQEEQRALGAYLSCGFVEDLPHPLRDEVERDTVFLADIGRSVVPSITVDGLHFEPEAFWAAASEAVNGRAAALTSLEGHDVTIHPREEGGQGRKIGVVRSSGEVVEINDATLELLHDSPSMREAALRRHLEWIDAPEAVREKAIADLPAMNEAVARMEALREWYGQSARVFYRDLPVRIRRDASINLGDLRPPSGNALLHYHRFIGEVGPGAGFTQALEHAAAVLVRDVGLTATLFRLAGLPVPLPSVLRAEVSALPRQERAALFRTLIRSAGSPISRLHLVRLLWEFRHEERTYGRMALRIAARVLRDGETEAFKGFCAMVAWVAADSANWPGVQSWPAHLRLAMVWSHTHHLYTSLRRAGVPETWLGEPFKHRDPLIAGELFGHEYGYLLDVVHPTRLAWLPFTVSGLAYALGSATISDLGFVHQLAMDRAIDHPGQDGTGLPNPLLFHDPTLASNEIGSFLGWDRDGRFAPLLGDQWVPTLSRSSLEQVVGQAIEQLRDPGSDASGWFTIALIVGTLPVYPTLALRLDEILKALDIVRVFKQNRKLGALVLRTASFQAAQSSDPSVRSHLREQWFLAAAEASQLAFDSAGGGETEGADPAEEMFGLLMTTALDLAAAGRPADGGVSEFVQLLSRLIDIPGLRRASSLRVAVERLCLDLHPRQSRLFWPVLVRLRAERGSAPSRGQLRS